MIAADNSIDLLKHLADIDISVPRRSEGRTKEHTQRYTIVHLLSALATTSRLTYPLHMICRDRPDFLLNGVIGIEHTEAVPENEAHRSFLREQGHGTDVCFMTRAHPTERKKTAKKLIVEIERNDPGDGWAGDSVERDWSDAMLHFVERKITAYRSDGFERFPTQWLLI